MQQPALLVTVGERASVSKTVTETDVAFLTAISGDFDPLHMDERFAHQSSLGRRTAPNALAVALVSGCASKIVARARERGFNGTASALGYDRVRFVHPVFIGDTLTLSYVVETVDSELGRSLAGFEARNQDEAPCVVGQHVIKWIPG